MKTKRIFGFFLFLTFFGFLWCGTILSQDFVSQCPMVSMNTAKHKPMNIIGGFNKPHRTNQNNAPSNARLNVLLVFVQFADENTPADCWPIGGAPTYMNQLLSPTKVSTGNYWDRYDENNAMLSDWYQEVSKGQMHVTGTAFNIILSRPAN